MIWAFKKQGILEKTAKVGRMEIGIIFKKMAEEYRKRGGCWVF